MPHLFTFHSLSLLLSWEVILDAVLHCWPARLLALWQFLQSQIYVYSEQYNAGVGFFLSFSFLASKLQVQLMPVLSKLAVHLWL